MARNSTNAKSTLIILILVVGGSLSLCLKIFEITGPELFIATIVGFIFIIIVYKHQKKKQRLEYLRDKYKNEELVQKINDRYFWIGQTSEQLLDALGKPAAVDNKILKTKIKDVWKYNHRGANRYALRITVEDGFVVGWDKKS
ncbi:hypothetical protein [Aeromonas salmonicida]|uniref:hypothetical protein n=1 Tax=Aeromonas salmonicida TaxID=645 RepID=UPI00232F80E0|nr:hypothetical protein [Aeromonas salmonicida]WCH29182.1 hypothetical protein ONZ66_10390 [Aeromonas salmonicida]